MAAGDALVTNASRLVIFFHPFFSDGGVERTNIYMGKGLVEKGYQVVFLTTLATDHFRNEVDEAGIQLVELGGRRTLLSIGKIIKYLVSVSSSYSQVYFISCQYYANVVSMLIAMMLSNYRKKIQFINSERNHFQEFSVNGGIKNKLILFLVRHVYRFADLVIANSEETARDLSEIIGRKVYCVYNPTINDRIDVLRNELLCEGWFLKDQRPCVIGIGRLSLQKDFSTLIDAFRLVRNSIDAKLVILGDGDLRVDLECQVRDLGLASDVYMPGFVENPYKYLASSDVFVLSSRYEGLPNVLIEAAYLQIPCVSTACKSGPNEVLMDGKGGDLVPIGDAEQMADAILSVLAGTSQKNEKVKIAFCGTKRFQFEKIKDDFEKIIFKR